MKKTIDTMDKSKAKIVLETEIITPETVRKKMDKILTYKKKYLTTLNHHWQNRIDNSVYYVGIFTIQSSLIERMLKGIITQNTEIELRESKKREQLMKKRDEIYDKTTFNGAIKWAKKRKFISKKLADDLYIYKGSKIGGEAYCPDCGNCYNICQKYTKEIRELDRNTAIHYAFYHVNKTSRNQLIFIIKKGFEILDELYILYEKSLRKNFGQSIEIIRKINSNSQKDRVQISSSGSNIILSFDAS